MRFARWDVKIGLHGEGQEGRHPPCAASAEPRDIPLQTTVASPWPFFMQLSGQGPALSGDRVVWTATSGQRQAGAEANRIYTYDLDDRRLNVAVRSHFGALGFIGSYALVGAKLAYVDTGFLGPTAGPSSAPSDRAFVGTC